MRGGHDGTGGRSCSTAVIRGEPALPRFAATQVHSSKCTPSPSPTKWGAHPTLRPSHRRRPVWRVAEAGRAVVGKDGWTHAAVDGKFKSDGARCRTGKLHGACDHKKFPRTKGLLAGTPRVTTEAANLSLRSRWPRSGSVVNGRERGVPKYYLLVLNRAPCKVRPRLRNLRRGCRCWFSSS